MNNIYTIIIFLLLIIIFYLFFQNLFQKIDYKLNNISVKVESEPVKIELPKDFNNKFIVESKKYDNNSGESIKDIKNDPSIMEKSDYILEGFDQYHEKNKEFEQNKTSSHLCSLNHKHNGCSLGIMNYPDPKDLSEMDYKIFKLNYPPNMTMQDYVNWLYCQKDNEKDLPYNHLKNLDKLKRNIPLEEIKGECPPPAYKFSPLESEKYFDKLYDINNEFRIASQLNTQVGPLMAYNSDEYSEFNHNFDSLGSSSNIRNCDIGIKKTAKEVNEYVFPRDSNNLEQTKKYKKFYQKSIEI